MLTVAAGRFIPTTKEEKRNEAFRLFLCFFFPSRFCCSFFVWPTKLTDIFADYTSIQTSRVVQVVVNARPFPCRRKRRPHFLFFFFCFCIFIYLFCVASCRPKGIVKIKKKDEDTQKRTKGGFSCQRVARVCAIKPKDTFDDWQLSSRRYEGGDMY